MELIVRKNYICFELDIDKSQLDRIKNGKECVFYDHNEECFVILSCSACDIEEDDE